MRQVIEIGMRRSVGLLWCVAASLAISTSAFADVPGDGDGDADVGIDDFALMSTCHLGPDLAPFALCGEPFDFDFDGDVDMSDFAAFQLCFSGENLPKVGDCAGHQARIEGNCLHIIGTVADSTLALRLQSSVPAILEVDVGNDGLAEFAFDRETFNCIRVSARSGDDLIIIDETNGVFTNTEATTIDGGRGNDTLVGGSGGEVFIGGDGNDSILMGAGNDRSIWNPGDDTDLVEGEAGIDTVEINGGNGAETFTVTANGTRVRFDRLSPAPFNLDINACENLVLNANGGNDSLACTGNLAALIQITADGGAGDDTLLGSNGIDVLLGGEGQDFIDGQQGNDLVFGGDGDDIIQWDPGDGSDIVEGQTGQDLLRFNGSNANEVFDFSANGSRVRFTRNVASVVLDVDEVEQFDLQALGGADVVTVNDLAGTDAMQINLNLAATLGGSTGDAQPDNVIVNGTNAADTIAVAGGILGTLVTGLSATVNITVAEPAADRLTINALGGADNVSATGLGSGVIGLTLSGGTGNDVLTGSGGADVLMGDDDNDTMVGGAGDDTLFMGTGNDRSIWNPGDGTDIVEGDVGIDTVEVNGGDGAEDFTVTANGTRVRFDRINPSPFSLDINACENLVLNANGGNDTLACTGNLTALIQITADGGPGNDTLLGSNGVDLLLGGDDQDFIDGNQANDVLFGGAGDDTVQWDPGDGSDTVEGQAGHDILVFNGSNASEIFDFSANGFRLRFTRNVGNVVMDVDDVEQFDLRALGSADTITLNSLSGTDVAQVNIDLAGTLGGASGDAQADALTINGTELPDTIHVASTGGGVEVSGLAALVRILRSEAASDRLTVNGLGGADTLTSDPGVAALIMLVLNP